MTVCDKFTPTVLDGRLCYKVDVNSFVTEEGVKTGPGNGLTFVMDYNEDRMIETDMNDMLDDRNINENELYNRNKLQMKSDAMIYINTLGKD